MMPLVMGEFSYGGTGPESDSREEVNDVTKQQFEHISLLELAEFYRDDWDDENNVLADPSSMRAWNAMARQKARSASILERLKALDIMAILPAEADADNAIFEMIRKDLLWGVRERIEALETSMAILLKKFEDTNPNITVGELNQLRGGFRYGSKR